MEMLSNKLLHKVTYMRSTKTYFSYNNITMNRHLVLKKLEEPYQTERTIKAQEKIRKQLK